MDIYISICCDRHSDEDIKVFTDSDVAIRYARDFVPEWYDIKEEEPNKEMKACGWIFFARYGVEGDCVRVEKSQLDPPTE